MLPKSIFAKIKINCISMNEPNKSYDFNTIYILKFILRYKTTFLLIGILAFGCSVIFTMPFFITPKYQSEVIFYPAENTSVSSAVLEDAFEKDRDAQQIGSEDKAEQALQILNSNFLMGRVIERFDLMKNYEIDINDKNPYTRLGLAIKNNISFGRTEFASIFIKVRDKDPLMAAAIANGISEIYDSVKIEIQRQTSRKAFEIIQREYENKTKEVNILQNKMDSLSNGSSISMETLNSMSAKTKNQSATQLMGNQRSSKGSNIGTLLSLTESIRLQVEQRENLRRKYEKANTDITEFIPQKFEISKAEPAETRVYPVRWIIALVVTSLSVMMSVLVLLFADWYKSVKSQLN